MRSTMDSKIRKVLLLGSGALKIGEAGEFDYSGSQALKALKEEGISTVLINPNIATIQTSEELADHVYLLPVNADFAERVIEKEKPDGILVGFGGQTALNCGLEIADRCLLQRYGVRVLGTPIQTIRDTEDRALFVRRLTEIGVDAPRSQGATTLEEAKKAAAEIGYPVMVRIAFALGGLGSGVCKDGRELEERVKRALAYSPQVLVEEYLNGWKEVEYEVVRDESDNCITVCNMENVDPLGIHTGESIVVAPSQTLTNGDYHRLRELSIRVVRHLKVVGECNIQFALDPKSDAYRVIEVNARLSRSSALASKATGYPLAYIAAKLALGYSLTDLRNSVTRTTTACFEPALDYVVVKIPRWDLKKFRSASSDLGSGMKSVGEVMAIGRTFEEALQKAARMLDIGHDGIVATRPIGPAKAKELLAQPEPDRVFALPWAMRNGHSVKQLHELTHIDEWFLHCIHRLVEIEDILKTYTGGPCPKKLLFEAKRAGFSDRQLGSILEMDEMIVWRHRQNMGISPVVRQIDTLAAEYPAQTNYLYLTFNGEGDDVQPEQGKNVLLLGSGAYRIGSSVEFDWCCVNASRILGTSAIDIDRAEDRHKFSKLLDSVGVDQPPWREALSLNDAVAFAEETGYPVLLRPSYVLSGAAMGVATNARECELFLNKAADVSPKHPVVVSKFFEDAKEIEVDAVASRGQILVMAVVEHVENAGVHSGVATLVVPPQRTYPEVIRTVEKITERIAEALTVTGPLNVQYLAQGTNVKVIEANLRASRSFPFVSKICKVNFIELAMKAILDVPAARVGRPWHDLDYVGVKAPHFSFTRLQGADPTLGVEMASTGEVGCLGDDFEEAFLKALISVGFKFPIRTVLLSTGTLKDKVAFIEGAKLFESLGIGFFATQGTAEFLSRYSIKSVVVHWPLENRSPNAGELIEQRKIDLVINIPKNFQEIELTNDYYIRRKAVDFGIPLLTNIQLANRLAESLSRKQAVDLGIKELQAY